jgi:hypothetical protein
LIVDEVLAAIHGDDLAGARAHGRKTNAEALGFGVRALLLHCGGCGALGLALEGRGDAQSAALNLSIVEPEGRVL